MYSLISLPGGGHPVQPGDDRHHRLRGHVVRQALRRSEAAAARVPAAAAQPGQVLKIRGRSF